MWVWQPYLRKTAASACIAFCTSNRIFAVGRGPSDFLVLSKNSTLQTSLTRDLLVWLSRRERLLDTVSASTAEYDDVKQRVGTETVRTVDRYAGGFTSRIETRDNLVLAILVLCDNLTGVPGRNTAH